MIQTIVEKMNNILEVQEDSETGELYLQFEPDMLNQMGWCEGDVLEWIMNDDGTTCIQKANDFDVEGP